MLPEKAINWFDSTCRSLQASVPQAAESAFYVTERLSALLLQRLPSGLVLEILELLPQAGTGQEPVARGKLGEPDSSIGFVTFVEVARHVLGVSDLLDNPRYADSEEAYAQLCQQVAEAFLWAIAQELPADLKFRISAHLPSDLRCRMNLYTGYTGAEKVA